MLSALRPLVGREHELATIRELETLRFTELPDAQPYEEIERRLDMKHGSIGPTRRRCLEKLRALMEVGA